MTAAKSVRSDALLARSAWSRTAMNAVSSTEGGALDVSPIEPDPVEVARRQMFLDLFASLEACGIRYVILAGYEGYPDRIDSDVDFMVSEEDFDRLPALLFDGEFLPGARLVQVLRHETSACYYVLARQIGQRMAYLHADAAANYRRRGRLWLESERVLSSRRRSAGGFWVPAPDVEFEYYLVKRIEKGLVGRVHLQRLSARFQEAPEACRIVLDRLFTGPLARAAAEAISGERVDWFARERMAMRAALAVSLHRERLSRRICARWRDVRRLWRRVRVPTGFVIAVLGSDGSGKTTIIGHLEREFAPAFRRVRRFHLRPRFGRALGHEPCADPHGRPPRGRAASLLKLAFFLVDYLLSWLALVIPMRARSSLVVFDRYYHDMLVDAARYRLPSGFGVPGRIASLIPKPDMWLVLHAPAADLLQRKREVTEGTLCALNDAYRELASRLPHCTVIETTGSLDATLERAVAVVRCALEVRTERHSDAYSRE